MSSDGSVAPRERINIKYKTANDGQEPTGVLDMRTLVLGKFGTRVHEDSLEDRQPIKINKSNFTDEMRKFELALELSVPNRLDDADDPNSRLDVNVKIDGMGDFEPDGIVRQVPELVRILELRESLLALRSKVANEPKFRRRLQELLSDEGQRARLLKELGLE